MSAEGELRLERMEALREKTYRVGNHIVKMGKPNERYVILEHTTGSKGEKEVEAQRILPDGKLGATWRINYGSYGYVLDMTQGGKLRPCPTCGFMMEDPRFLRRECDACETYGEVSQVGRALRSLAVDVEE